MTLKSKRNVNGTSDITSNTEKNEKKRADNGEKNSVWQSCWTSKEKTQKGENNMTIHQRKLTEEDLKKIEENGGDLYCMFSEAQIMGYGVYGAQIVIIDGQKFLRYSMGDSCD